MRFFKSFGLLHRRSKSDTALTSPSSLIDDSPVLIISASPERADLSLNQPVTSRSLNQRVFEVGLENEHLIRENALLSFRLALVETQLRLTMSELYAEMHKNVHLLRQTQLDRGVISDLQETSQHFQRFLSGSPSVGLAFKNFCSSPTSANEGTDVQTADSPPRAGISTGRQSDGQQYSTALQIIIKTRQELRSYRKISSFWKRKAKSVPENEDLVTPSPSEISEVQDVLPKERIDAVTALRQRRQLASASATQATIASASLFGAAPKLLPAIAHTVAIKLKEESNQVDHSTSADSCRRARN